MAPNDFHRVSLLLNHYPQISHKVYADMQLKKRTEAGVYKTAVFTVFYLDFC